MPETRAYLAIEETMTNVLRDAWFKRARPVTDRVMEAVQNERYQEAQNLVEELTFEGLVAERRARLRELGVSALLQGASRLTPLDRTELVEGRQAIPDTLDGALDQMDKILTQNGTQMVRDMLVQSIAEVERQATGHLSEKSEVIGLRVEDHGDHKHARYVTKNEVKDVADMLNEATVGTGRAMVDLAGNLTTSRLTSYGFLSEAVAKEVSSYQVSAVLDGRSCPVCRYMHGKSFEVTSARTKLFDVLQENDPEALRQKHPWPGQSKDALHRLYQMPSSELAANGYEVPPYHPLCRCTLVEDGTETQVIEVGTPVLPSDQPDRTRSPETEVSVVTLDQSEIQEVQRSGISGRAVLIDKDQIEDHQVLVQQTPDGFKGSFKYRAGTSADAVIKRIEKEVGQKNRGSVTNLQDTRLPEFKKALEDLHERIALQSVDGISPDMDAADDLLQAVGKDLRIMVDKGLIDKAEFQSVMGNYSKHLSALDQAIADIEKGVTPKDIEPLPYTRLYESLEPDSGSDGDKLAGLEWSVQEPDASDLKSNTRMYVGEDSQTRVTFLPRLDDDPFVAVANTVTVEVKGEGVDANRIFDTLDSLGMDASPVDPDSVTLAYMRRMARQVTRNDLMEAIDDAQGTSLKEQVADAQSKWERILGQRIQDEPDYNPEGFFSLDGQYGYRRTLNPLRRIVEGDEEWSTFKKNTRVIHDSKLQPKDFADILSQSDGQLVSTTDKIRRGIELKGQSPTADLRSGGADYVFTRLRDPLTAYDVVGASSVRLIWKGDVLDRADAIHYRKDLYGRVDTPDFIERNHHGSAEALEDIRAGKGQNETLFKKSLPIMDAGLEAIGVRTQEERREVIQVLKDNGVDAWPDGRPVEDVVVILEAQ